LNPTFLLALTWLTSLAVGVLLVLTKGWHGRLSMDGTVGVQKFHQQPTPRIGGLPVMCGLVLACTLVEPATEDLLLPLLIAALPAFGFGLAEDLTKRVGVATRLLATMASGVLGWWLTDYSLTRVGVWGLDGMLQWLPLSVLFTAFAVGGVANSINIIDGFNGLASSASSIMLVGLGLVAGRLGDTALQQTCLLLAAAVLGFFCINWPWGKLFMGDGGSYFVGFGLAWVAVLLVQRHPSVSPFACLLACIHPITEVLYSIYRRRMRKQHPGMPDRLHFHSLFKRRYMSRWFRRWPATLRNSCAGLLVGLMSLPSALLLQVSYDSHLLSIAGCLAFMLSYLALYARMVRHSWKSKSPQ
jgi:UDP-N-acetylmuramyl pentapeptide phosphotransferase/UDP-N-acetylglucosamine-1-phosphate transferase